MWIKQKAASAVNVFQKTQYSILGSTSNVFYKSDFIQTVVWKCVCPLQIYIFAYLLIIFIIKYHI